MDEWKRKLTFAQLWVEESYDTYIDIVTLIAASVHGVRHNVAGGHGLFGGEGSIAGAYGNGLCGLHDGKAIQRQY